MEAALVTEEKAARSSYNNGENTAVRNDSSLGACCSDRFVVSISCPDGLKVHLSAKAADGDNNDNDTVSHTIIGRGKHGIPSSAAHISRKACVLRIVDQSYAYKGGPNNKNDTSHQELELVVLGSQTCRVTRAGSSSSIFVKSISQILDNDNEDLSPCTITIRHGDIIEPYERPLDCTIEEATRNEVYHPFKVSISTASDMKEFEDEEIHGAAFAEASRKINMAAKQESYQSQETNLTFTSIEANEWARTNQNINTTTDKLNDTEDLKLASLESEDSLPINLEDNNNTTKRVSMDNDDNDCDSDSEDELEVVALTKVLKKTEVQVQMDESASNDPSPETKHASNPNSSSESSSDESSVVVDDIPEGDAYHEITDILEKADLDLHCTFAVGGYCNIGGPRPRTRLLTPGLVIDEIGSICLPLSDSKAEDLAKRCSSYTPDESAPAHNTFQLNQDHFKITNPRWNDELDGLTKQVCSGLGVDRYLRVEARLSKLVLNEKDSSLAPCRDCCEKEEGLFGTLVIILPSQFTGGDFVAHRKGAKEIFEQDSGSKFGSQYVAFYNDCKHELKKITSGHRLCLVYNLVKVGYGSLPRAIDTSYLLKRLKTAARQWEDEFDDKKIILMSENVDTETHLQLLNMAIQKGVELDFDHGTVSYYELGMGERKGCMCDEEWHCDCYKNGGGYTWSETVESRLSLRLSSWGNVSLSTEEGEPLKEYYGNQEPESETFEPSSRLNRGDGERQYTDADVIVIWPRSHRWKIATNNEPSRMCKYLLKACEESGPNSDPREDFIRRIDSVIPRVKENDDIGSLMKCIVTIGEEQLGKKLLISYLNSNKWGETDMIIEQLGIFIDRFGADNVKSIFATCINETSFTAYPSDMANLLIKYCNSLGRKSSNKELTESLIESFVNAMGPQDKTNTCVQSESLESYPLNDILDIFTRELWRHSTFVGKSQSQNSALLSKRVLEGYIWMSCQKVEEKPRRSWHPTQTREPKGPSLLPSAVLSIISLGHLYGWGEYEAVLVEAVEKLCLHGSTDAAVILVEKMTPPNSRLSTWHRVYTNVASVLCEKALQHHPASLESFKSLVKIIGWYSPSFAPTFVAAVKTLDMDIFFPLVSDRALRSSANECMKRSLSVLTLHCAKILKSNVYKNPGSIEIWSLPNAALSRNTTYSSFLRDPCKQVYEIQVRKSDHNIFLIDLRPLIHLGEVKAESYQPRGKGAWHFKITKTKTNSVPVASFSSLRCTCSSGGSSNTNCRLIRHKASMSKHSEDQKKLLVVRALLTIEQRGELEQYTVSEPGQDTRKRSAPSSKSAVPAAINSGAQQHQKSAKRPKSTPKTQEVIDLT